MNGEDDRTRGRRVQHYYYWSNLKDEEEQQESEWGSQNPEGTDNDEQKLKGNFWEQVYSC